MEKLNAVSKEDQKKRNKHNYNHHPPKTAEVINCHSATRMKCENLANWIVDNVPFGREQSIALTKLEEVMFWMNAGIARIKNYE